MKTLLAIAVLALLGAPASADSTIVDVTATNCLCGLDHTTPINLSAQLTVEQVTGTFFQPNGAYYFTGTVDEIVALTGEVNGFAMTFAQSPQGDSWIGAPNYDPFMGQPDPGAPGFELGYIYFSADGIPSWMFNDVTNYLEGFDGGNPITYSAVDPPSVPEPSLLLLLPIGLLGLAALKLRAA